MSGRHEVDVDIREWTESDLPLLERLLGDPAMTAHLGGPESSEQIRTRHQRYCRDTASGKAPQFVIVVGKEKVAAGWVGYWEKPWDEGLVWETGWSVLPEFQGQGIATQATCAVIERARAERKHQFIYAFPSVENGPSNAICRKVGFTLQEEMEFEYPPGKLMRCNNWRFDLFTNKYLLDKECIFLRAICHSLQGRAGHVHAKYLGRTECNDSQFPTHSLRQSTEAILVGC